MSKKPHEVCSSCGQNISRYKAIFNHTTLTAAIKAYLFAKSNNTQTVRVSELRLTNAEYTTIASLVLFGLLFKNEWMEAGEYGVPRERIWSFWMGKATAPAYVWRSPVRDGVTPQHELAKERIYVHQVPKVKDVQAKYGATMTEYEWK